MQTRSWFYAQRGQSLGPVPEDHLRGMLASGDLYWDDLVWREGMAEWLPARQVQELVGAPPAPAPAPPKPAPFAIPAPVPIQLAAPIEPVYGARQAAAPDQGTAQAIEWLRMTKPWVRFLAVLGLVVTILSALAVLGVALTAGLIPGAPRTGGVERVIMVGMAIVMLAIQLPPLILLNRYASRIGALLQSRAPLDLEEALRAQKSFWKYVGILTLIVVILYALIFAGGMAMGLAGSWLRH